MTFLYGVCVTRGGEFALWPPGGSTAASKATQGNARRLRGESGAEPAVAPRLNSAGEETPLPPQPPPLRPPALPPQARPGGLPQRRECRGQAMPRASLSPSWGQSRWRRSGACRNEALSLPPSLRAGVPLRPLAQGRRGGRLPRTRCLPGSARELPSLGQGPPAPPAGSAPPPAGSAQGSLSCRLACLQHQGASWGGGLRTALPQWAPGGGSCHHPL